jgi:hypothetical protein
MQRPPTPEKDKVAGTRTSPRTLAKANTSAPKKSQSAIEPARLVSILEKATPEEVTEMLQASFQQGGKASKVATKTSKLLNKRMTWSIAECEKFVSLIADTVPIGEKQWVDVASQWSRIANENHYAPRSFEQLRQKYSDLKKANRKPTGMSGRTRISKLVLKAEEAYAEVYAGGPNSDCDDEGSVVYASCDDVRDDDQQDEDCLEDIEDAASSVTALGGVQSSNKTSAVKSKGKRKKEKEVISRRELRTQREDMLQMRGRTRQGREGGTGTHTPFKAG